MAYPKGHKILKFCNRAAFEKRLAARDIGKLEWLECRAHVRKSARRADHNRHRLLSYFKCLDTFLPGGV